MTNLVTPTRRSAIMKSDMMLPKRDGANPYRQVRAWESIVELLRKGFDASKKNDDNARQVTLTACNNPEEEQHNPNCN